MKLKKVFRNITIVLSILVLMINIPLYLNMEQAYEESKSSFDDFGFALFIFGILLMVIVWIQYFIILAIIKVCNKYRGLRMWLYIAMLTIVETALILVQIFIVPMLFLFIGYTYGDFII